MKKILFVAVLMASMAAHAQAVDVTFQVPQATLTRLQTALGEELDLRDANGARRIATPTEVKARAIVYFQSILSRYAAQTGAAAGLAAAGDDGIK